MSLRILGSQSHGGIKASALLSAVASKNDDLEGFLGYWRDHRAVTRVRLVDRTDGGVMFRVDLKSNVGWVTKAILDNNGFFPPSLPVAAGIESWRVFIEEENKTSLLSTLDRAGALHVDQVHQLKLGLDGRLVVPSSLSALTSRQLWVLRGAMECGYFEFPRRVGSREVSKKIGIAQSTFLEHLRKAQSRILRRALAE